MVEPTKKRGNMTSVSIYLAGNIAKSNEKSSKIFWTDQDTENIRAILNPRHVSLLNPAERKDDLSDNVGIFGRDMVQVFCSDVIFVDARERRGLGVGAEMMWAKMNDIPVVTLAPSNSHYLKDEIELLGEKIKDYTHPFVDCLSDAVIESVEAGAQWILDYLEGKIEKIKGHQDIKEAMAHYKNVRYEADEPMKHLSTLNHTLRMKIDQLSALA